MTAPAAGWYPDPAGTGGTRWWDGGSWTEHAVPSTQAWAGAGAGTGPWAQTQVQAPRSLLARNRFSLLVLVFAALYLVLALTVHVAVLRILPALMAVRAVRAKEPLAGAACVLAVGSVVLAITGFAGLWRF